MVAYTHNILAMWTPGPIELIVILIVAVLIFGRRLPEIARGMGKSLTEFKKGLKEAQNEVDDAVDTAVQDPPVQDSDSESAQGGQTD